MTGYAPTPADVDWLTERAENEADWRTATVGLLKAIAEKAPVTIKR